MKKMRDYIARGMNKRAESTVASTRQAGGQSSSDMRFRRRVNPANEGEWSASSVRMKRWESLHHLVKDVAYECVIRTWYSPGHSKVWNTFTFDFGKRQNIALLKIERIVWKWRCCGFSVGIVVFLSGERTVAVKRLKVLSY